MNLNQPVSRRTFLIAICAVALLGVVAAWMQSGGDVPWSMPHVGPTTVLAAIVFPALALTPLALLAVWRDREAIRARADKAREQERMRYEHRQK